MPKAQIPEAKASRSNGVNGETNGHRSGRLFAVVAHFTARAAGRPWVFMIALGTVIIWILTGPIFNFSDTWQLVINTGTTIVTFLMVFLIQNSQNRDGAAIQVKLDELIRVSKAHNSFVGLEHLTDNELEEIRAGCEQRAKAEIKTAGKASRTASKI
jgi:low affinity Fe/Cu permease